MSPSRSSHLSTTSSCLPSIHSPSLSPRPLSSSLSLRSEDSSASEQSFQRFLDHLLPGVSSVLSQFDRVNQISEDIHNLEIEIEEALTRRRNNSMSNPACGEQYGGSAKELEGEGRIRRDVRQRRKGLLHLQPVCLSSLPINAFTTQSASAAGLFHRTQSLFSKSESLHHSASNTHPAEAAEPVSGRSGLDPAGSMGIDRFPRRRAWHSGSSHSADAVQRIFHKQGGFGGENLRPKSEEGLRRRVSDGVPRTKKAWTPETERN